MMQIAKYNLSGWLSNSFLPLLLVSFSVVGQSADSGTRETLASKYSLAMLEAHQANSLEKVGDFYHYLNLLSATDDKTLQQQIKENIFALFEDKNVLVDDFTTDVKDKIPLSYLLDNIASRQIRFAVVNEKISREFYRDYWFDSYDVEITANGVKKTRRLKQTVYFRPEDKAFGSQRKTVLAVSLGTIQ